ncbi:MAG TPA: lytic transglycosylase domain-containing protein [Acidisphaera sp.]|nr:lytic transglycosylase domain-containing protein [Acidisphaera sp.]
MRWLPHAFAGLLFATQAAAGTPGDGGAPGDSGSVVRDCLLAAARVHRLPPALLVILLNVEGGSLGHVSHNTNGTVDIGPMQVNQIWLPQLAARWNTTVPGAFAALRDNFCANVEAGAWILRKGLDEPGADF